MKTILRKLTREIQSHANKSQALNSQRFFKTAPGEYGAGDIFLGITVLQQRKIIKNYLALSLYNLHQLLLSPIHEFRFSALLILIAQYQVAFNLPTKKIIVDFYLKNISRVNNWDLVDLSAGKILGNFLWEQEKLEIKKFRKSVKSKLKTIMILNKLASSLNLWERRIAMVATYSFIKNGQGELAFKIAKKLLTDDQDLIHKAVGWMLRELGKEVSEKKLLNFLNKNYQNMPRTTLRYAIEQFSPEQRKYYLQK